uniref:MULE transposase domain-containing protein n=1 Tax=Phlebotomus papatasi TaxID=29031 RepID=A0A1B0DMJ0_PHLPP
MANNDEQEDIVEYCESVLSQKGRIKINVRGYLMVKEKCVQDIVYWCCEKKKSFDCKGRASTTMCDGRYRLLRSAEHNHAPVASEAPLANLRQVGELHSVPLVYVLMTSKKEELYKMMLQELSDFAAENHIELCPEVIITDLELAAINASKHEFPTTTNKACNFHLGQCIWKKIQSLGYASRYGTDEDFSLKLRHLLALAFLPSNEIPDAFDLLKSLLIPDASELLEWFEQNYIHGRIKRTARNKTQTRTIPLFPPTF